MYKQTNYRDNFSDRIEKDQRADISFNQKRPTITRSVVKRLILEGIVTVNNEKVLPNYRMKFNDEFTFAEQDIQKFISGESQGKYLEAINLNLSIIYEDENIILVNKPAGLDVHPVVKRDNRTLLNGLYYHLKHHSEFDPKVKLRLVHRLDKDTSGVVLVTKNLIAHDQYSKLFENRNIEKTYYAVVHGDFEQYLVKQRNTSAYITSHIGRSHVEHKKSENVSARSGKLAKTAVYFESHFNKFGKFKFSVVKAVPLTGRTHQIRVHLSSIGYPILGDKLYGGQKYKRMMLHAYSLSFRVEGKLKTFVADVPEEFLS